MLVAAPPRNSSETQTPRSREALLERYGAVRRFTETLCAPLETEDYVVQPMPDASPAKWHLAHTSWFFETFVLKPHAPGYRELDAAYAYLFNSYYVQAGARHCRDQRGMITRPTVRETYAYRAHVDRQVRELLDSADSERLRTLAPLVTLGIHHEQQHQELIVTDLKYLLSCNPLRPAYLRNTPVGGMQALRIPVLTPGPSPAGHRTAKLTSGGSAGEGGQTPGVVLPSPADRPIGESARDRRAGEGPGVRTRTKPHAPSGPPSGSPQPLHWIDFPGGLGEIGHAGDGFCYDNETPRHRVYLEPFRLASRPVSNGEYLEFVGDGGYQRAELWVSDGWAEASKQGWKAPLYWERCDGEWQLFTTAGMQPLDADEPVCHLSHYEADAYARWRGARIPSEAEWETASADVPVEGHFVESGHCHPLPAAGAGALLQIYGDVWEWTRSAYAPFPGFQPLAGALGEYNGKFMCNQFVLRGGSCATSVTHIRPTYRNFFHPHCRWQFTGIRLARDAQ